MLVGRFIFGLGWATHSSYDYPWGLFLSWGLFTMVPLSASGFMLGTTVELFGSKDFKPIERLGLLNGLLGYFFAVVFLQVDLGQPWRLIYPMFVSLGPAAVLFLVAWHVATYLSVQIAELVPSFSEWMGYPQGQEIHQKHGPGADRGRYYPFHPASGGARLTCSPTPQASFILCGIQRSSNGSISSVRLFSAD